MATSLSPTSVDSTPGELFFSAATTIASISSTAGSGRDIVTAAAASIDATRLHLYNYRQYRATFPELVEGNLALFENEFDRLNEKLGNAFKSRQSRLQYIRFWESPERTISRLDHKMDRLKGRIVSASADVETEINSIENEVQSQLKHELNCELLEEYQRQKPVKIVDFIAETVRPRAAKVLPPKAVELYVVLFTHRLQNPDKKREGKTRKEQPSTTNTSSTNASNTKGKERRRSFGASKGYTQLPEPPETPTTPTQRSFSPPTPTQSSFMRIDLGLELERTITGGSANSTRGLTSGTDTGKSYGRQRRF